MTLKRWHWIAIILATIALVVMAPSEDGSGAKKNGRPEKSSSNGPATSASTPEKQNLRGAGRVELELLAKLEMKKQERNKVSNVFNQTSWYVAPPAPPPSAKLEPPPPPPPPPAPTAPPMPFTYLGRYGDTDTRTVVLTKGDKVYTVTVGDVIDNTYRVEKFTTGMVNLTYLPLNIVQSLHTGESL